MTCNQPPDCDALHGTCRGSVEPLPESGSPRTKPTITSEQHLFQCIGWKPKQGDLVFSWSIFEEEYVPYQFEAHLCSKVAPLCWVINLDDGRRIKKKLRDLWIPRT